jgi:hypothetical protein
MSQINDLFIEFIKNELELEFIQQIDIKKCVLKCIKHIKCHACCDTKKILLDNESFFGGYYEEFTCPLCTGNKIRLDSHHQIYHAQVNGRQVPYNGGKKNVGFSRVISLYNIYKKEFEQLDILQEENERIKKESELLAESLRLANIAEENEKNKPLWDFMDSKELKKEITSLDVNVDISKLIHDVNQLLIITTAGNLVALPSFLKSLNVSLKYYWENESSTNSSFYKTKDDKDEPVYIKFEYNKQIIKKNGGFGLFRMNGNSNKEYLNIIYFIAKPKNEPADKICSDLMNITIQSIVNKIKK